MLLLILVFISVSLTCVMFASKQPMLGFPCAIFWAITGADAFILSVIPWGDIYFYIFIASLLGMTPFTAYAAFALREPKDTIADSEMDEENKESHQPTTYIDEGGNGNKQGELRETSQPSSRVKGIRARARARRVKRSLWK